jgi:hypothetical protein
MSDLQAYWMTDLPAALPIDLLSNRLATDLCISDYLTDLLAGFLVNYFKLVNLTASYLSLPDILFCINL